MSLVISFTTLFIDLFARFVTNDYGLGIVCFFMFVAIVGLVKFFIRGYGNTGKLFK